MDKHNFANSTSGGVFVLLQSSQYRLINNLILSIFDNLT